MTIQQMQDEIIAAGWQFQENVFNDDNPRNCYIQFSKSKSPHVFSIPREHDSPLWDERKGMKGWGRYERQHAWEMAYNLIIRGVES
jgi:hypothetical protein